MLSTFTLVDEYDENFEIEDMIFPIVLFDALKRGVLNAFRVDLVDSKFQVTISGDDSEEYMSIIISFADGPSSVEYHISP